MNKEFRIGDLFTSQNGNTDLKKEHINGRGYPVVSSGLENTGIIGLTDIDARILPRNTITVDMFGNVFFRDFEYKLVTHARVFSLIPKGYRMGVKKGLYVVSMLSWLSRVFSYNNMCSYKKIENMPLSLPVIESSDPNHEYTVNDIDWQYMEDRIKELEEDRIRELEEDRIRELDTYLKVTNLDDYELTDEDKKVLSLSRKSSPNENGSLETGRENGALRFKKFNIGDLFDVINNPQLDKKNFIFSERAKYPYFTRTENNNGIYGYVRYYDDDHLIPGNSLAVGMISMQFHYMHHDFYAGQFTKTLIPRFGEFNENLAMYFIAILNNHSEYYQSYLVRHFKEKISETVVELPAASNGEPDFDYMERYIRAIEKLTIADVVKYKDKVIDTTKMLVKSES
ncbi:restriction endonuclease subunit S [Fannyhessea vaginae]|uniref:restriction endonuclease subunit S n=1 Tax=Fannyhessea vaginae TaxID=82135 RepID=UPI0023F320BE|nr:restriction endonuclease subunit S [Fannyhessea vaginae]